MFTALSQLFITERHRPRAGAVGHSVPLASEIDVDDRSIEPVVVSTTRGTFLESRVSRHGYLRFGFSECRVDLEGKLVLELHGLLVELSKQHRWGSISPTPESAVQHMLANGEKPFHLAAGPWLEVDEVGGARVLDVGMPQGVALLVTSPVDAGLYTRIGDYVGLVAYRVNRAFVAVVPS